MIRKLLLVAALVVGGLVVNAAPAQAARWYIATYPTQWDCYVAGQAGIEAGWTSYDCIGSPSTGSYKLYRVEEW